MIRGADFEHALLRIPYARYLGLAFDEAEQLFYLPFREDLVGNLRLRAVHGGALGALMENAALIWLGVTESQQRIPKPVDFSVDYLRSARAKTTFAGCEVLRQGRRVAQVQVRCWQADPSTPVAVGRGHFLLEAAEEANSEEMPPSN